MEGPQWTHYNSQQKQAGHQLLALTAFQGHRLVCHWLSPDGFVTAAVLHWSGLDFPSLSPHLPEVAFDEREIHDLFGYVPKGHPDLRPLMRTPRWPADFYPLNGTSQFPPNWLDTQPDNPAKIVEGDGVTVMKVGPTHAGIIESGHFVFSIIGENVLHLDLHLFQNHRGVEKSLEGLALEEVPRLVSRICGADTVSHQTNWAMAVEQLAGYQVPETLRWERVVLLESERVLCHLNDLAQIPAGVGFQVAHQRALAMKELWQRGLLELFGHRLLFDTVQPGGAARVEVDSLLKLIQTMNKVWHPWRNFVEKHHGFNDRMTGVGLVRRDDAARFGAVGVAARAAGLNFDVRTLMPLYQNLTIPATKGGAGDVAARFKVRLQEVESSWRILQIALNHLREAPAILRWHPPEDLSGEIVSYSESPHGLNVHVVELEQGHVRRYHVRPATFRNWPLVAMATAGNAVADFPLINKSFELCYSCSDR
ncbi:NADH-ubiquinone oxidoreductase [Alicyclobacillaceae bacterium I2511]|nr:NADH-ubiquinone oxidoreductase [Alicyclobacillaceae bacterium I2511]